MKRIIFTRPDGGVSVVCPVRDDDEFLSLVMSKVPKDATNVQVVDETDLPTDRTFRDAWRQSGEAVTHDMPKCREIHRERLRAARVPLLAKLDVDFLRAVESGDTQKQTDIAAEKQVLRDITVNPAIDSAKTPEELKVLTLK